MTVREPTAIDSEALCLPLWELPEPKTIWERVIHTVQSIFYGIVARLVYFLRYYDWRQTANVVATLLAETRSAFFAGYWSLSGNEKTFQYYGLNPTILTAEEKEKPAILLLHGKGSNQSVWVELAKTFQKEGVPNVFTLNSHDGELTDEDIPLFEAKLKEISRLYDGKTPEVIVIGHSRGAEFSLFACLQPSTFKLEEGYCTQLEKWERFRPEIRMMIRLGSPMLQEEREALTEEMLAKIFEIDGLRDLIIPDRSLNPYYQADCGHLELIYSQEVHKKILQLVES